MRSRRDAHVLWGVAVAWRGVAVTWRWRGGGVAVAWRRRMRLTSSGCASANAIWMPRRQKSTTVAPLATHCACVAVGCIDVKQPAAKYETTESRKRRVSRARACELTSSAGSVHV